MEDKGDREATFVRVPPVEDRDDVADDVQAMERGGAYWARSLESGRTRKETCEVAAVRTV